MCLLLLLFSPVRTWRQMGLAFGHIIIWTGVSGLLESIKQDRLRICSEGTIVSGIFLIAAHFLSSSYTLHTILGVT